MRCTSLPLPLQGLCRDGKKQLCQGLVPGALLRSDWKRRGGAVTGPPIRFQFFFNPI